jgi:predicted transcriptional regulator
MNKVLENALKRAGQWPESAQQELAEIAVQIDRELAAGPYQPTTEELAGIEAGLKDAEAGRLATDEEVAAVFAKYRRP